MSKTKRYGHGNKVQGYRNHGRGAVNQDYYGMAYKDDGNRNYKRNNAGRDHCGLITYVDDYIGIIDKTIYFFTDKDLHISAGNLVHATVTHAPYKRWKWKAVRIKQLIGICSITRNKKSNDRQVNYMAAKILKEPEQNNTKIIYLMVKNNSYEREVLKNVCLLEQDSAFDVANLCDNKDRNVPIRMPILIRKQDSIFVKICYKNVPNRRKYANLKLIFNDWELKETLIFHPYEWIYDVGNETGKDINRINQSRSNMSSWLLYNYKRQHLSKFVHKQSVYEPPEFLKYAALQGVETLRTIETFSQPLNISNYTAKFHQLLYLEELAQEINSHYYDIEQIKFERQNEFFFFHLPVHGSKSPKIRKNDEVVINSCATATVHNIEDNKITLIADEDFAKTYQGEACFVHFSLNKSVFHKFHLAISKAKKLDSLTLFPEIDEQKITSKKEKVISVWFNNQLNAQQKRAINGIINGFCKPLPYLIFGPPGTGKTSTIVEAIMHLFTLYSTSRILACAPSNSAADVLCEKLIASDLFNTDNLVRLYAYSHSQSAVPTALKHFADVVPGKFSNRKIRILITTCVTACLFHQCSERKLEFTHIFIDEAAQAHEPETLVPLTLGTGNTLLVLSGDPFQLGPVIYSQSAKEFGLNISLMERLMKLPTYSKQSTGKYFKSVFTKLVHSFRFKDTKLLEIPSCLFYENELVTVRDPCTVNTKMDDHPLVNSPLVFRSVEAFGFRDISLSWSNPTEISYVYYYVLKLKHHYGFDEKDIGIITPYHRQVEKIKMSLYRFGISTNVKVGSVEEFQGHEKEAIIISTVRTFHVQSSSKKIKNVIGFLADAKRFNVCLTRSKSILIIIGDPRALTTDQNWNTLIEFCKNNNAFLQF